MLSLSETSTALLAVLAATATAAPANKRDNMCRVEAWAVHVYGGGGPGQGMIDFIRFGVNCYDAAGNFHWQTPTGKYNGGGVGIDRADCGTQENIWIQTSYDGAANHFNFCGANYHGLDTTGTESDNIDSGTVSEMTSTCTYYFTC